MAWLYDDAMPKPPTPSNTTIRIDPELRPRLDEYRHRTRHSLNAAINLLIEEGLDRWEQTRDRAET